MVLRASIAFVMVKVGGQHVMYITLSRLKVLKIKKGKTFKEKVFIKIAKINRRHKTAFRKLNFCLMSVRLMFWPPTLPTSPTRLQVAEILLEPLTKRRKY